jgi:ribonuclease P protein component
MGSVIPPENMPVKPAAIEIVGQYRFRRKERLKRGEDIRRVFNRGKTAVCSGVKLFFLENGLSYNRIAFTFRRKFGNAVERNRSRRLSREAYRLSRKALKTGFDFVVLVSPGKDVYTTRIEQMRGVFLKAAMVAERG